MIRKSLVSGLLTCRQSVGRFATAANARSASAVPLQKDYQRWQITGFTRYASRIDLLEALGDLKPIKIDPVLDSGYYFQGKYILTVPADSSLDVFKKDINTRFPLKFSISPVGDNTEVIVSRKYNITNCTVRCKIENTNLNTLDELYLVFEGFGLQKNGITKTTSVNDPSQINYFIQFTCPEEAERAVTEKENTLLNGVEMRLYWYQC